jgi:O-antigen ligase
VTASIVVPVATRPDRVSPHAVRRVSPRGVAFCFLLLFAASVPLEAIAHLGPLGSLARTTGIAAALAGAWALCTDLRARPADRTFFACAMFMGWITLSYFWSENPGETFARAATCLQLLLLAWLIWQEARSSRACEALMKAYIAGAAIACADAFITRRPVHKGVVRFAVGDPNDFGVSVAVAMVMAYHIAVTSRSRPTRLACACFLPIGALGIFLTASRTAVMALLVATLVMVLDPRNLGPRRVAIIAVMTAVIALVIVHYTTQEQIDRIATTRSEVTSGSLDQRTTQWSISWREFSERPILGIGAGTFRDVSERVTGIDSPAHSVFLGLLADTGAPGLLLFASVVLTLVPGLRQLPRKPRRAWIAISLVWLIGAATLSWEHRKITWFLFFLLAAHIAASRHERVTSDVRENG